MLTDFSLSIHPVGKCEVYSLIVLVCEHRVYSSLDTDHKSSAYCEEASQPKVLWHLTVTHTDVEARQL